MDLAHLESFIASHRGVEAFVEPATTVTPTTVLLVAGTGEWTRRRVADPRTAQRLALRWGLPAYDAAVVGYPARMRQFDAARRGSNPDPHRGPRAPGRTASGPA